MKLVYFLTIVIFSLVIAGCTSYSSYENLPPTSKLDIFREGAKPDRKYREVGMLGDDGRKAEQPAIEGKMIKKAKAMGGNAIIFMPLEASGSELTPGMIGLATTYAYKGIVVVYE